MPVLSLHEMPGDGHEAGGCARREEQGCGVKVEKTSGKKLNKHGVKNSYMHFLLSLIIILV